MRGKVGVFFPPRALLHGMWVVFFKLGPFPPPKKKGLGAACSFPIKTKQKGGGVPSTKTQ